MAKFGKWVGLGLGWALGGPIGGILGLAVGSIFDSGTTATTGKTRSVRSGTLRGDYAASLLVLIAAVMKADGKVMKSELDHHEKLIMLNDLYEWASMVDAAHPVLSEIYMHLKMKKAS